MGVLRRQVMPLLEANNIMEPENYDRILSVCHLSISQTDPTITTEDLENALMLTDLVELFQAVIKVSGLNRKSSRGEALSQERVTQPSSGETSMDLSQQQPDGDIAISTVS